MTNILPNSKSWFQSRTIWFGVALTISGILQLIFRQDVDFNAVFEAIIGIISIMLRIITKTEIRD